MKASVNNPLVKLGEFGQSPWLDTIRRSLVTSGELEEMVERDGLKGVTSNPAIFEKAITGSTDYAEWLEELRPRKLSASELYETLAVRDIQAAADVMKRVYDATEGFDGYVSLEVSPYLANDTERTLDEAQRLWKAVGRQNLMIKVPATAAGMPAIEQLIAEGINVNVTLLFSRSVYERVAEAYIAGLEKRAAGGGALAKIASVASFFVSRIDSAIDNLLNEQLEMARDDAVREAIRTLLGKTAVANAKLAYQSFRQIFEGPRWESLAKRGGQKQRLLWASTGAKNPSYSDVLYVDELIGRDTVNTIPMATMNAFRDHGNPEPRLEKGLDEAREVLNAIEKVGVSLEAVTEALAKKGVGLFAEAFDKLLSSLDKRCRAGEETPSDRSTYSLPEELEKEATASLNDWRQGGKVRRLWECDASLWTNDGEGAWLGWLGLTEDSKAHSMELQRLSERVRSSTFEDIVVLGMGGSSLCPEVLKMTFGKVDGFPELHILDSTDPAQVRTLEGRINLEKTLFIVSSKSGSTLEPNIFKQYFYDRVQQAIGSADVGERFIAVTDPGSSLEAVAKRDGFKNVFHGVPSVGGRYSALSNFGMVPAAAMGLDVSDFLERADVMAVATSSCVPVDGNPGAKLGAVLGAAANRGKNKLTLITSPGISDLGAWLEQLLAESTGKQGKGIIPVDREHLGLPEVYGEDRLFVYLRLKTHPDPTQDQAIAKLVEANQPVVQIPIADVKDLGQEFFRWEIATAVAGAIMGINPFNQPDVEASKVATRKLTAEYEKTGRLPNESPFFEVEAIQLFADPKNTTALTNAAGKEETLSNYLRAHLSRLEAGDYFALLAYIEMNRAHEEILRSIRHAVRDEKRVATCLGFGPRFLHSTGQAYKGGPNSGLFLQLTCDDKDDIPVPGQKYTFGIVKSAQARGDFEVLAERGRRVLRVHLGPNVETNLQRLKSAVRDALR